MLTTVRADKLTRIRLGSTRSCGQHGFLPELFKKWGLYDHKRDKKRKPGHDKKTKTNHVVTVILFSRVCYDQSEKELVSGPLKLDPDFGFYQDFVRSRDGVNQLPCLLYVCLSVISTDLFVNSTKSS